MHGGAWAKHPPPRPSITDQVRLNLTRNCLRYVLLHVPKRLQVEEVSRLKRERLARGEPVDPQENGPIVEEIVEEVEDYVRPEEGVVEEVRFYYSCTYLLSILCFMCSFAHLSVEPVHTPTQLST